MYGLLTSKAESHQPSAHLSVALRSHKWIALMRLPTAGSDILAKNPNLGVYVEVEVRANADNLSLAVVDFENGGRSSVTFSPETGAVLRERKVRESPRAIEGTYIHLLPPAPPGRRFEGAMGLYLQGGQLAFFRQWRSGSGTEEASGDSAKWETTGFCTDLRWGAEPSRTEPEPKPHEPRRWAQGPRLSLCLAFRDTGAYRALITQVNNTPPLQPLPSVDAYKDLSLFVSVRICIAYGIDRCIRSCLIRFQLFSNPGTVERHRRR
eukprot:g30822.t1